MKGMRCGSLSILVMAMATGIYSGAPPPSPPSGPALHIAFTGVILYKRVDGSTLAYKVLAPDAASHIAYIRFSARDYQPTSTLRPSATSCSPGSFQYVELRNEGLTIEPRGAVTDQPPVGPPTALDAVVHLKDLSGGEFNDEYDQPIPKPKKIATQFLIDRGQLLPDIEPGHEPWIWEFWEFSQNIFGTYSRRKKCDVELCGISGIDLRLNLRNGEPISFVSSRDPKRRLVLKSTDGKQISITIGNSRKKDIECKGKIEKKPDGDFEHHFMMVKNPARKCIPFPGIDCPKKPGAPSSMTSKGGSDCVGAQWP
jgi:hypothetical protein